MTVKPLKWGGCEFAFSDIRRAWTAATEITSYEVSLVSSVAVAAETENASVKTLKEFVFITKPFTWEECRLPFQDIRHTWGAGLLNTRVFNAVRNFAYTVAVQSRIKKEFKRNIRDFLQTESIFVPDTLPGVISDVGILRGSIAPENTENYIKRASAWGFTDWEEFENGAEIYFREMLMKLGIKNTNPERVSHTDVTEHIIEVDVPDIVEKGMSGVARGGNFIPFINYFHAPPVVTVTLRTLSDADFAIPMVTNTTKAGFTVTLIKIDGAGAVGSINWVAQGY
jgi:hypothetical protein